MIQDVIFDGLDAAFPLSRPVRWLGRRGPDWGWFKVMMFGAWVLSLLLNALLWLGIVIVAYMLVAGILGWPFVSTVVLDHVRSSMSSVYVRLLAWLVLVLIAVALYQLRVHLRSLYGCAEVLVGCGSCWTALQLMGQEAKAASHTPSLAAVLALSGGVYIIVRGLDNYAQGKEPRPAAIERRLTGLDEHARM